jgi:type VI secretion system protein ImpL
MSLFGKQTSSSTVTLFGCVIVAALAWFFGPLLPMLQDWVVRLALVTLILLTWAAVTYAANQVRRQRDATLTGGVTAGGDYLGDVQAHQEEAVLQDKLTAALQMLGGADRSRRFLYDHSWYAMSGPPGAGKTTALMNAGLRFPLAEEAGAAALKGVGGTRSCEWWFTEQAVLIDTAGRYTTQDSDAGADRAGWYGFLDLLKNTRPKQPLNGVIVAIALNDIVTSPNSAGLVHARLIRQRVNELQTHLSLNIPTYVLFTKADLIAGFTEFFGNLDSTERSQVWGMTFDLAADRRGYAEMFATQFRDLVGRLEPFLFRRLETERSLERRTLIAMFPGQMRSLEQPLTAFLKAVLSETPGETDPFLRGVYFTSATQEGTPIDRLTGTVARLFSLELRRPPVPRAGAGQSYFLERLLHEVIFGEARLVSTPPATARRHELIRAAGLTMAGLAVVTIGGLLWHVRAAGLQEINNSMAAVQAYEHAADKLSLSRVADADLRPVVPLLDKARAMAPEVEEKAGPEFGFFQYPKLGAATRVLYRHALERILLPRLVWRLELQIRGNMNRPEFLYEATRVYLMIGGAGPLDRSLVRGWMRLDWQGLYPDDQTGGFQESLLGHLDALLAKPLPSVPLDGGLVARARETFVKVSPAQRAYSRIQLSAAAQRLAPWRPSEVLGAAGIPLFMRTSGRPLSEGVAGLFTVEGFHTFLRPRLNAAARAIAAESWVIGQLTNIDTGDAQMRTLESDIIRLYEVDYAQVWDAMLGDLNVIQLKLVSQAARDLYILASPQSPMRALLASIARQLTLSVPISPASPGQPGARESPVSASSDADGISALLFPLLRDKVPAKPSSALPGQEIDERYSALRELVGSGPGAPIDQMLRSLSDMQQQFAKAAASSAGVGVLSGLSDPTTALRAEALRQPEPLARWLTTLATSAAALRNGSSKP